MIESVVPDANVILRYLLNDHPRLSAEAEQIIDQHQLLIRTEIVCEVLYVLEKVYKIPRDKITAILADFIGMKQINCPERNVLVLALKLYSSEELDFVDNILIALNQLHGMQIRSFDKKLCRLLRE